MYDCRSFWSLKPNTLKYNLIQLLKRPFPEEKDYWSYLRGIAWISLFITVFLYTFQPFNLDQSNVPILGMCIGFGVITFVVSIIYDWIMKKVLGFKTQGPKYTLGRWIAITLGLILLLGVVNFFYLSILVDIPYYNIWGMLFSTLVVGLFPLVFIGTIAVVKGEQKYGAIADNLQHQQTTISGSSISLFDIPSDQIRYIEAMQNYVRIWYFTESQLTNHIERTTLAAIESLVHDSSLQRCHRSYIVNRSHIEAVAGNAQGLQLSLSKVTASIPVSRKYVDSFR